MAFPLAGFMGGIILSMVTQTVMQAFSEPMRQEIHRLLPVLVAPPEVLIRLRFRREITDEQFYGSMARHGFDQETSDRYFTASEFFPTPQDLVNWQAKEVFEPRSIEKYGLDDEFEALDLSLFSGAGVTEAQALNFWRAHWQHPPFNQVVDMRAKDVLDGVARRETVEPGSPEWEALRGDEDAELFDWYKLVEIPPAWRPKLSAIAYDAYTRVDARRMWSLGVLDDSELLRAYLDINLPIERARNLVLFTKVFERYPELIAAYRNGWISVQDIKKRLAEWGLPEERIQGLIQERVQNYEAPLRVQPERDLTKAEIIKGAKKELISREQAENMLLDLAYDPAEARFIIMANLDAVESPETPLEFARIVQSYRSATGREAKEISERAIQAEKTYLAVKESLAVARSKKAKPDIIDGLTLELAGARRVYDSELFSLGLEPTP